MSQEIEGARTPSAGPYTLAPGPLRVVVHVDPLCLDKGFNASGPTVVEVDVAALEPDLRPVLRSLLPQVVGLDEIPQLTCPRTKARLGLPVPTLDCLAVQLRTVAACDSALADIKAEQRRLSRLVGDAFEMAIGEDLDSPDILVVAKPEHGDKPTVEFGAAVIDRAVSILGESLRPDVACLGERRAELVRLLADVYTQRPSLPEDINVLRSYEDWHRWHVLWMTPVRYLIFGDRPKRGRLHERYAALNARIDLDWAETLRARSPGGIAEGVVREHGTPSQVERHEAGMLPEAELDDLLGRRAFWPVHALARPESRLEREDVERAVLAAVPGASVTKVAFSTEEAKGCTEAEWQAFKPIRDALPDGMEANLVRTVAHVQTARDGSWVLRRPLVSLKARLAERDLRARFDLGCPPTVTAA